MAKRNVRRVVDQNLLTRLQTSVSTASDASLPGMPGSATDDVQEGPHDAQGEDRRDSHGLGVDRSSWLKLGPARRQLRTTLSMPVAVGERARRLAMALTLMEERDVSLGSTLGMALDLLDKALRDRGARVPEKPVELRTGRRHV